MLDMRDLGMEVRGGSRQVRWKAWGQPSQQISSPPSLHTAHSSSLAWACTQRCWSSVDQQQLESSVDALSTPSAAGSPLWLKVFSTALKALLVSSDRSQEWNIPSTFRQRLTVPVKKKKKKKGIWWPDVNSLSTFGVGVGGGGQTKHRNSPAVFSSEPNTCLIQIFSLASGLTGSLVEETEDEDKVGGFWTEEDTIWAPVAEYMSNTTAGWKNAPVCFLGNESLLVPDVRWLAGPSLFTLNSFNLTPWEKDIVLQFVPFVYILLSGPR